jgi:hypothetical protein
LIDPATGWLLDLLVALAAAGAAGAAPAWACPIALDELYERMIHYMSPEEAVAVEDAEWMPPRKYSSRLYLALEPAEWLVAPGADLAQ